MDQFFSRTDSNGSTSLLTDALGSTVAETDSNGNVSNTYSYGAFGATTSSNSTANSYQYTGRENDGNGLYYYRARYYHPATGRFISEDPLGFAAGSPSQYTYALNSPASLRDPSGENPGCLIGGLIAYNGYLGYEVYKEVTGRKSHFGAGVSGAINGLAGGVSIAMTGCAIGSGIAGLAEAAESETVEVGESVSSCCFAAGTLVHTKHGIVPVEKIKVGDEVFAWNQKTREPEYKRVTALTPPHLSRLLAMGVQSEREVLKPSVDHPFWVKRSSKEAEWVKAADIHPGDLLLTSKAKWRKVLTVTSVEGQQTVYNFTVADNHDYFVGSSGVLVHNESACDIARRAAQGFGDRKCIECAENIEAALQEAGESGERIIIDFESGSSEANIYSDSLGKNIADNGVHQAVETDGQVFDNVHPDGMPRAEWEQDLHSNVGEVTENMGKSYKF